MLAKAHSTSTKKANPMPLVETTTSYRDGLYADNYGVNPCTGAIEGSYKVCHVGHTQVNKLSRDRRPKPSNLLANLTGRAEQSVIRSDYGKQVDYLDTTCWKYIPPKFKLVKYKLLIERYWPTDSLLAAPTVDWGQPLRLKIASRAVSFAETIGEYKEAISYLRDGAGILKRAWRTAKWLWRNRRHRRKIWKRLVDTGLLDPKVDGKWEFLDIASAHLSVTYGIRPVMGLLEESLIQAQLNRSKRFRVQVTVPGSNSRTSAGVLGGTKVEEHTVSVRAVAYVSLDSNAEDWTAGNAAEAIWAGTRLSFMVDWFFDVSSYLTSFTAMTGVKDVSVVLTTKGTVSSVSTEKMNTTSLVVQSAKMTKRYIRRDITSHVPLALAPRLGDRFTWDQLVSATEILGTLVSGRRLREL